MKPSELWADAKAKMKEAEGLLKVAAAEQKLAEGFTVALPLKTRVDPGEGTPSVADINQAAVAAHEAKL